MYEELVKLLRAGVDYLAPADEPGPGSLEVATMVAQLENLNEDLGKLRAHVAATDSAPAKGSNAISPPSSAREQKAVAELATMQEELKMRDAAIRQFQDEEAANLKTIADLQKQLLDSRAAVAEVLAATVVGGVDSMLPVTIHNDAVGVGSSGREVRLLVRYPKGDEISMRLPRELSIGRALLNDIRIAGPAVSRRHAAIRWDGETATLVDCGSTNGVFVNGVRAHEQKLCDGDVITVGLLSCIFKASA